MRQMLSPSPAMGWAWFDFANSSYSLVFQTFLIPVYFIKILGSIEQLATWGFIAGSSTVTGALLAIVLGQFTGGRRRFILFKLLAALAFMGMLGVAAAMAWSSAKVAFAYWLTNTLFVALLAVSDSFLPFISRDHKNSFITSGKAWGLGFMGGAVALLGVLWLQHHFGEFTPWALVSVALFFAVFVLLACAGLKKIDWQKPLEHPNHEDRRAEKFSAHERTIVLVGAWLIAECVAVAILFFSTYASHELGLSSIQIGSTLLVVQLIAFPATWFGGYLPQRLSGLWALGLTIAVWIAAIALLIFWVTGASGLWVVAALCGLVLGNTQSYLRALYSNITSRQRSGSLFGVYIFTTQAAAFAGTWLYGWLSATLGSQQLPMMFMALLLVLGFILIRRGYSRFQ